jgi:hypothetical protein
MVGQGIWVYVEVIADIGVEEEKALPGDLSLLGGG